MPDLPDPHALAVIALTVVALFLFAKERLPLEVTSLVLLTVLALGFSLVPYGDFEVMSLFHGFGHEALVAVCALMVLGQGLVRTGALEPVGRVLARAWGNAPYLSLLATLIVGAAFSAFVNNTPIVVLLLPILISVCLKTSSSPAAALMPMGLATLVGGMATTIGTSTNLLVVGVSRDLGGPDFSMFDFALPAVIAGSIAILYLWLVAPRLLPPRDIDLSDRSPRLFEARLVVAEESPVAGDTLRNAIALAGGGLKVVRVRRGEIDLVPLPDMQLQAGDRLHVRDTPQNLKSYEDSLKSPLYAPGEDQRIDEDHPLAAESQMLAEIAVVHGSTLDGANLADVDFLRQYHLAVLALHRAGKVIWRPKEEIHEVTLQTGDVLLVQGAKDDIASLKRRHDFLVVDGGVELAMTKRAPLAIAILTIVVLSAALGLMPIAISALAGACAMLLTRCLSFDSAIRAISPSVFFIVASSLALGTALIETGATQYITEVFLALTAGASAIVVLSALMLLLAVLTNVVSNNAAAVIGTPIAIGIAAELGLPAEPFVLAVLFGANMSYATPMAYKTNLLVMSAGNYRFGEFVKVGVPLTLIMWLALTWLLAAIYFP